MNTFLISLRNCDKDINILTNNNIYLRNIKLQKYNTMLMRL